MPAPSHPDIQVSAAASTEAISAQRMDITLSDGRRFLVEGTTGARPGHADRPPGNPGANAKTPAAEQSGQALFCLLAMMASVFSCP